MSAPCAIASKNPTANYRSPWVVCRVSRDWGLDEQGKPKPFDQVVMDIPLGSGPYKIGPVRFGKDITYVRDPHYWAKDLNVRRGSANFDRITVKIYKDATAARSA